MCSCGEAERLAGPARARHGRQAAVGQLGEQRADRPFAGGVGLECPGHERRALGVDLDGADLAAVLEAPDVEVADRRSARRAAVLGLLDMPLMTSFARLRL